MQRRNVLEKDPDGRIRLKVLRHRHESLSRLELQIDVLKEGLDQWPGAVIAVSNEIEMRDWYESCCFLQGASKCEVVVPEHFVRSKAQFEILIRVLDTSLMHRRKRIGGAKEHPADPNSVE